MLRATNPEVLSVKGETFNKRNHTEADRQTIPAPIPQHAATANMLKTAEPTMVPTPISPSVMNVPITFTKSSGADVAAAINVAPATSLDIFKAEMNKLKSIIGC